MPFDGLTALCYPTPQEHLNSMWKLIKTLPPCPPPRSVCPPPRPTSRTLTSPRHVRVHLYLGWAPGCDETEFVMRYSALVADFPLDRFGRLPLARVRSKWALRGCAVGFVAACLVPVLISSPPPANRPMSPCPVRYGPSRVYIPTRDQSAHRDRRRPQTIRYVHPVMQSNSYS